MVKKDQCKMFDYFEQLSRIPRESDNEEGVRLWLKSFAEEHNLKCVQDKIGNIIIYKPATSGYENVPPIALQAHMDMVCVKTIESRHDFAKDPIEIIVDGDFIRAKDTSLGADDGIGVAMILDILSDDNLKHGPIEGIFTRTEETGLCGAFQLEPDKISARKLINLDSEEEGVIYIGCAGGVETTATFDVLEEVPDTRLYDSSSMFRLEVSKLLGGHSGGEIHKQRANAIKVAARLLHKIGRVSPIMLASFKGGTRRNVIPSHAVVEFIVPRMFKDKAREIFEAECLAIKNAYHVQDSDAKATLEEIKSSGIFMCERQSYQLINALFLAPHGVSAMSQTLSGVVETSSNLAIIDYSNGKVKIVSSHRSSIESERDNEAEKMACAMRTISEADVVFEGAYPAWQPDINSPLAKLCAEAWRKTSGTKPVITAIHAGLECGIINSLIKGMDSVSIGPALYDVHSVNEKVSIASCEKLLAFVKELLSEDCSF